MAGFDNEVLYAVGERLLPSSAQSISIMQQAPNTTNVSRINYVGNPNGAVSANPSSLCHDPVSGDIWRKTAGIGPFSWATIGTGVISVSGTPNRITSTGGLAPIIDIDATYVGQTSITTLGTVTTGVWNGTAVDSTHGGTNQTTYATGDILYASAANTLSKLAAGSNTQVLTLAAGVPTWAAPTAAGVTSVSGTTNRITSTGGATPVIDIDAAYVGQSSITTLGTIGTGVWNGTTIAVTSGGTGLSATTINQILYSSASNVIGGVTSVNRAVLTANSTGVPIWRAITDGQLIIGSSSSQPIAANITSSNSSITVTNGANSISLTVASVPLDYTEIFLLGGM